MLGIDSKQLAVELINSIMAMDDLPIEVINRCSTALVLLDCQEGEDFEAALTDAYKYLQKDEESLEALLQDYEDRFGLGLS